ncbi:MAG: hypothetical protein H7329_18915 [Opitutaceae bacterium]|nr:hypothetical protein [Cytophagales bacterium]
MNLTHNLTGIKTYLTVFFAAISIHINAQGAMPYVPYVGDTPPAITGNQPNYLDDDTVVVMRNTISFHPLLLVDGTVALGYERTLPSKKHSARLILGYSTLRQVSYYEDKVRNFSQVYGEADFKFFLSRKKRSAPTGLYASPFVQYRAANFSYLLNDSLGSKPFVKDGFHAESISGGLMLGYLGIILEMVTLEAYMGVGQQAVIGDYHFYYKNVEHFPLSTGYFWNEGPLFKLGLSLGVNF